MRPGSEQKNIKKGKIIGRVKIYEIFGFLFILIKNLAIFHIVYAIYFGNQSLKWKIKKCKNLGGRPINKKLNIAKSLRNLKLFKQKLIKKC